MSRKNQSRTHGQRTERPENKPEDLTHFYSSTRDIERIKRRMDTHQRAFYYSLSKNPVTIVDAGAGRGKTTLAFLAGVEALQAGKLSKLIYMRFVDPRVQSLGYLPGELQTGKEAPYMKPAYDAFIELGFQPEYVDSLRTQGVVEFTTDATLRGTNIKDAFLIIDEAQNAVKVEDLKLILTRPHDDSRYTLIGHSGQQDAETRTYGKRRLTPFQVYQVHLTKKPWAVQCSLEIDYRGERSRWADEVWQTIKELEEEEV